ncbi:MAG: S41 family peptidase [Bacteroidales bacterium]|nr:S41 family peptidase [Bacteroidales bacterium]
MKIKEIINWKILGLSAVLATAIPLSAQCQRFNDDDDFELMKNLEIFHTIMRNLRIMYVDEISSGEVIKTAMDKMLESLDPYTVYYPESLVEDVTFMNTGDYAGIGIAMENVNNSYIIGDIDKDSPADKAGLRIGDKLLVINGKETANKTYDELELVMKGQPGTNVNITAERNGAKHDYQMKRAMISVPNIPYYGEIAPKVGYISLSGFTQDCGSELRDAFIKLKNDKKIEKLIIDLRDNPGGLLVEAVNIVNIFCNQGETVVDMRGRVSEWNKIFKAEKAPLDTEIPIAVLVNDHSASAAEIVSGALQDLDRAVIIGSKTYGKGLVQTTKDLVYNSKMKLTTAKYYIPSGRCIQKLDYAHKDSSGKASTIAESQYRVFKTKNGRPVKDAGGIMPDIIVSNDTMSYLLENLLDENIIFNYATQYREKHSQIAEPEQFSITESDLADFRKYAGEKLYNYETDADKTLKMLEETLSSEYSSAEINATIKTLKSQIAQQKRQEFEPNKELISLMLGTEIVRRYYYLEGLLRYSIKQDRVIDKAIEVLNDAVLYKKILSGK